MAPLRRFSALLLPALVAGVVLRHWPLNDTLPVDDLTLTGAAAGPRGTSMCTRWNSSLCHDPGRTCNQCRSNEPHVFHVTWCADTRGWRGISCDLDLGYRSAQGARYGMLEYGLGGYASAESGGSWTNASTVVMPDSPYSISHFAADSGKNDILTVFSMSMSEGVTAGDDLELTATTGFCCRLTLWGGKTTTGTIYVGDLNIRANGVAVSPSSAPAASPPTGGGGGYSGGALGGALVGGAAAGGALALAAQLLLLPRLARLGVRLPGLSATTTGGGEARGLLAAARLKSLDGV